MKRYKLYVNGYINRFRQESELKQKFFMVILLPFAITIGGAAYAFGVSRAKSDDVMVASFVALFFIGVLSYIFLHNESELLNSVIGLTASVESQQPKNWLITLSISSIVIVVLFMLYRWVESGGIYYMMYPMAKVLDEHSAAGKTIDFDIEKIIQNVDINASKKEQAEQLSKLLDTNSSK